MALRHHPYLRRKLPLKRKRARPVLGFTEMKGMVLGILTQTQGLAQQPLGYLNKEVDPLACSWLACLRAVAAATLLIP